MEERYKHLGKETQYMREGQKGPCLLCVLTLLGGGGMTANLSSLVLQDIAQEVRGEWAPGCTTPFSFEPSRLKAPLLYMSM